MRNDRMHTDATGHERATTARTPGSPTAGLVRLDELDDYKVADGYPDPRGWDVKARDGRKVGEVKHLLVDRQAMRAAYIEVELDRELFASGDRTRADGDRLVHVPVASARLDDDHDDVLVDLDGATLAGLGLADRARPAGGTPDAHRKFFGNRARSATGEQYLVLHEEQLAIGKRQVSAGEVSVRKTVETERVRETVPVRHEEVTVERRAVSPDEARTMSGEVRIGADEIRVPVMREEVVAEKRVVPTEEVVLRKHATTEQRVVEETVRKEHVTVDGDGVVADGHADGRQAASNDARTKSRSDARTR